MSSEQNKVDREAAETSEIKAPSKLQKHLNELQFKLNVKRIESTICNYLLDPDTKDDDPIHWRMLCVLFSRFDTYCQYVTKMKHDIIHIISTLIQLPVSSQEIRQNMREWIKKGQRYQLLLKDLGGPGNLLVLPQKPGESFWTKTVPKKGKRRDKLIQSLLKRGVHRQACAINAHETTIKILNYYLEQMIYSFLELLNLSQWKGQITLYYDPELVIEIPVQPENWNIELDKIQTTAPTQEGNSRLAFHEPNNTDPNERPEASFTHSMASESFLSTVLAPLQPDTGMSIVPGKHNTGGDSLIRNKIILPPISSFLMQSYDNGGGKRKHHLDTNTSRKRMRKSHAASDPSPPNTPTRVPRNIHSGSDSQTKSSNDQDRAANYLMHESRLLLEESGDTHDQHSTSHLDPLTRVPDSANTIGENQYQSWPSTSLHSLIQPLPDSANGENRYQLWPSASLRSPIQPSPTLLDGTSIRVLDSVNRENQYESWPSTSVRSPTQPLPDSANGEDRYQSWPSTLLRSLTQPSPTLLDGTPFLHDTSQKDTEPADDLNPSTTVHPFNVFDYTLSPTLLDGTSILHGASQKNTEPANDLNPTTTVHPFNVFDYTLSPTLLDGTSILHNASQKDTEPANDLNPTTTVHPFNVFDYTLSPTLLDGASILHNASQKDTEPANNLNPSATVHSFDVFDYTSFNFDIDAYANQWFG